MKDLMILVSTPSSKDDAVRKLFDGVKNIMTEYDLTFTPPIHPLSRVQDDMGVYRRLAESAPMHRADYEIMLSHLDTCEIQGGTLVISQRKSRNIGRSAEFQMAMDLTKLEL
jgi:hypothetical protein